jgi:hypothetical protein
MPDFTFTSPEGKSYTVSGPDGATQEQAWSILQSQMAPPPPAAAPAAAPQGANGYLDAIKTGAEATYDKAMGAAARAATAVNDSPLGAVIPDSWKDNDKRLLREHMNDALAEEQKVAATPGGAGLAGSVAEGLAYAPALWMAPGIAGAAEGNERYEELHRENVDDDAAVPAALVHGGINAGAQMLPMGKVLVKSGGKALARSAADATGRAAAVGGLQEIGDDGLTQQILEQNGYRDEAKQFEPSVEKAAQGAAFMAGVHVGTSAAHGAIARAPEAAEVPPGAPEAPAGYTAPAEGASVADQLAAVRAARPVEATAPVADAETVIASHTAAADAQRTEAATKLDGAQTVDEMAAAASELASRPNDDVVARAADMATKVQDAAGAATEDALHTAAADKLNEALDAEAETSRAKLAEAEEAVETPAESTAGGPRPTPLRPAIARPRLTTCAARWATCPTSFTTGSRPLSSGPRRRLAAAKQSCATQLATLTRSPSTSTQRPAPSAIGRSQACRTPSATRWSIESARRRMTELWASPSCRKARRAPVMSGVPRSPRTPRT